MSTVSAAARPVTLVGAKYKLIDVTVLAKKDYPAHATITLDIAGRHKTMQSAGVGSVDAVYQAIKLMVPHDNAEFLVSHVENEKQSRGSTGIAHVRADFRIDGATMTGEGSDIDTLVATAKAILDALNQIACFEVGTPH